MQTRLPDTALLARYAADKHYTDCFVAEINGSFNLEAFVTAFYTTPLFRCERLVLRLFGLRSSDGDIAAMLAGQQSNFAAWTVEDRNENQLLMCDVNQRTRSWFKVESLPGERTRLYFGSAVLAGNGKVPKSYGTLLGFHRLYSRALLRTTHRRLKRQR